MMQERRRFLLFGCARLRRCWPFATLPPPFDALQRRTVEVLEKFADELVGNEALEMLLDQWVDGRDICIEWHEFEMTAIIRDRVDLLRKCLGGGPFDPPHEPSQADLALVLDLYGDPSRRPSPLSPSLLDWNDGLVVKLVQAAYEERDLPPGHLDPARLNVLADALIDAGCTDTVLLEHLRGSGPHVRGCWAIDVLTGRE
jgi:hypothetical protein